MLPSAEKVAEDSPHILYYFDLTRQTVLYANRRLTSQLDYSEEEAQELPMQTFMHPDDCPRIGAHFERVVALKDGEFAEIEYRMRHRDGSWRWFYSRDAVALRDLDGKPIQMMGTVQDVTRRREAEIALQSVNEELTALISQAPLAIYELDERGIVKTWNPAAERMYGWTASEVIGKSLPVVPEKDYLRFLNQIAMAMQGGIKTNIEERAQRRDGTPIEISISSAPLHASGGELKSLLIIAADVTPQRQAEAELKKANEQLCILATTDGLTGLKNHRTFQEHLVEICFNAGKEVFPPALLLLDVDFFKQYNDTFGHPAGDEVLRHVARILHRETQPSHFVARYGGEEFVIVLSNCSQPHDFAERLRKTIQTAEWSLRPVTVSIGISLWTSGLAPGDLIQRADEALYYSKRQGRNRASLWRKALPLAA